MGVASKPSAQPAKVSPTASAQQEPEITRVQVLSDFRFATRGIGTTTVGNTPTLQRACRVTVYTTTRKMTKSSELLLAVGRLQARGWKLDGNASIAEGGFLKRGVWKTIAAATPIPEDLQSKATGAQGMLILDASGRC
ncbi:hypothetical protein GCM10009612_43530 [Streptomyces beijiangensis]